MPRGPKDSVVGLNLLWANCETGETYAGDWFNRHGDSF